MERLAAIIPVAGLSSRMGSFKPLLELNGFTMIRMSVQSAFDGGVQCVCVVTGKNAQEVSEAARLPQNVRSVVRGLAPAPEPSGAAGSPGLSGSREPSEPSEPAGSPGLSGSRRHQSLLFAHNADFASTDMLQSIKQGLATLQKEVAPQAVFVLPGDMPGVSPRTFTALFEKQKASQASVLVPSYRGQQGHPLLITDVCFDAVLDFNGEGGLKHALSGFDWHRVEVDDPGILLDADTPDAYAKLASHVRKTRGVSEAIAEELFAYYGTPSNVREHTAAVAEVAVRMATALNAQGAGLDTELCRAGGDLHDLNRLEPNHSEVAAENLKELGYEALSAVVRAHDRELKLTPRLFTESNLVFVADKLVKDTTLVSIPWRYRGAVKRFPPDTRIGKLIQKDSTSAKTLLDEYVRLTHDTALLEGTEYRRNRNHAKT